MNLKIGLLSESGEIEEDFKNNFTLGKVITYRSVEAINREDVDLLAADCEFFESSDSIQFFLSKIRKRIHDLPVIILIKVSGLQQINFDWFFDDFLMYPFRKGELDARLKRLLKNELSDDDTIVIGNMRMNIKEYAVSYNNEKLDLTYKEFELLRLFFQNRGVVFSRKDLLSKIWGLEYIGGTRTVDVHIRRLRSKLGDEFNSIIETVRNVGYKCRE